jgi:hypothetical protein
LLLRKTPSDVPTQPSFTYKPPFFSTHSSAEAAFPKLHGRF